MEISGINAPSRTPVNKGKRGKKEAGPTHDISDTYIASGTPEKQAAQMKAVANLLMRENSNSHILWEFRIGNEMKSPPVIDSDGTLYAGCTDKKVYAIDGSDGTQKWQFDTGQSVKSPLILTPEGTVIAGTYEGTLICLDKNNGQKLWEFKTGDLEECSPTRAKDGTIYVKGYHDLFAVDSRTGKKKWKCEIQGVRSITAPSIDPAGIIYVGSSEGKYFTINPATGKKMRTFKRGALNYVYPPVMTPGGSLYLGAPGHMYSLDRDTGQIRWKYNAFSPSEPCKPVVSPDGTVFVLSPHSITRVEGSYGSKEAIAPWSCHGKENEYLHLSFDPEGNLYVSSSEGKVYILDPSNGKAKHTIKLSDVWIGTPPAVAPDGSIFVSGKNKLYAVHHDKVLEKLTQDQNRQNNLLEGSGIIADEHQVIIKGVSLDVKY